MSRFYDLEPGLVDAEGNTLRSPREILVRQDEHHVTGKRLGRHLEHDPRSKSFGVDMSDHLDTATFQSVAWERQCAPFDQGNTCSCTGNAMAGLLMTNPFFQSGRALTENDAIELYKLATHLDRIPGEYPPDDTGSSGLAVAKAAKEMGYMQTYRHAFTMRALLKALQSGPFIAGFGWYNSFDAPDVNGTVLIQPGSVVRGGHEVVFTALKVEHLSNGDIDEVNSLLGGWNSWGTSFALGGAFNMSLTTWRHLMNEYADVTVPVPPVG